MGKNVWYWSGSRSSKSKGGGTVETPEIPSGCMCALFQPFHFHPFHFNINNQQQQQQQQQQPPFNSSSHNIPQGLLSVPKGAEAPRNSLESEDGTASSISKDQNLKIPKNIRVKTSGASTRARGGNLSEISSEIISSPGTKSPTLVARLMGLDLLPDAVHSSSSSSSSSISTPNKQGHHPHHMHHHLKQRQHIQLMKHRNSTGSYNHSLHDIPRSSDVEHRRLSLQINKENMDLDLSRFSFSKRKCNDENYNYSSRSPSYYARQIVKQVKESVTRKVGVDITNSVKSREQEREEFVNQLRIKKSLKKSAKSIDESSPGKYSSQTQSPKLSRFMDTKNKPGTKPSSPLTPKDQNTIQKLQPPSPVVNIEGHVSRVLTKAIKPQTLPEQEWQKQKLAPENKKISNERSSSRIKKPQQTSSTRKKQEETFVIRSPLSSSRGNDMKKKSKRTHPLQSNVLNNLNTKILPVKTDPSPPATKIPQKQRYKQEALAHTHSVCARVTNDENKPNAVSTITEEGLEFQYISTILTRTTTAPHKHFNFQWFSPSHPLDPSIFHQLELYPSYNSIFSYPGNYKYSTFTPNSQVGPRCNRRLLFDLVDELLSEIVVKPKWCNYDDGKLLLERVWKKVRSFPRAKCEVLEDIDRLVDMDEGEGEREEGLVAEIEAKILETLVHETVTVIVSVV
ncbi:PREDICTED: uncharacterized protein LOC109335605 isoform X2 [Lupinus angustifolius]|uniref:uncharacterized protein LOC109335605 isoform X2 n=1 Tax=Lupinus angustifolius TaxID=3871 RepID=UPI00092F1E2B|nr:PREDICTED: uncharacterized protein LOC109335605 isoform X2 [Lupinus angustifolius]